jgi:hypothetical protein
MCPAIDKPASCQIRAVVPFFHSKNMSLAKSIVNYAMESEVMLSFSVLTKKIVKDGASQFQKFRVNFHEFHALFSTSLSQLG